MIRMKHEDPNVSASFITGKKDEKGGYRVPDHQVDMARSHGFFVCHLHEDGSEEVPEKEPNAPEEERVEGDQEERTPRPTRRK